MSGPLKWNLNVKSRNGHRALSKVPREHRAPFATTPPIAQPEEPKMEDPILTEMRRILREVAASMHGGGAQREAALTTLDALDDKRLCAVAQEALANISRVLSSYRTVEADIQRVRKDEPLELAPGTRVHRIRWYKRPGGGCVKR